MTFVTILLVTKSIKYFYNHGGKMGKVERTIVTLEEVEKKAKEIYWRMHTAEIVALRDELLSRPAPARPATSPTPYDGSATAPHTDFSNLDDQALYFSDDYRESHPFAADGRPTCPAKQGKFKSPFPER